ncbi:MAG: hypothetical protein GX295_11510 [Syntrophomonadaceae bacterium]|nr:hypothetical protein [Syntrophomonadaceae bacterium]
MYVIALDPAIPEFTSVVIVRDKKGRVIERKKGVGLMPHNIIAMIEDFRLDGSKVKVVVDVTGIGEKWADEIEAKHDNVERVFFSLPQKVKMNAHLKKLISQGVIQPPKEDYYFAYLMAYWDYDAIEVSV